MATVFLGLGSNQGDRMQNLRMALQLLAHEVTVNRVSSIYETEPVDYLDQPWFLNAVCQIETELSPRETLALANRVEQELGRQRTVRYGPRTIDVDILLYDNCVIDEPDLRIPHPEMAKRAFVLVPLAEIGGHIVHPRLGTSVDDLMHRLGDSSQVRLWKEDKVCTS
ncbi:MAG: 2-amino-4-hydroxy-6-hydroxymethyldihydropteridine diphosphokinase [Chloroflexi bacterium]|nr:2-amino-4-hydroxy-6-hydroxymethyldihydropteridine diphosphokinase [Chloroflexota bacterium]MDA8189749.1 2-amino-4-hydroxy-6-hydroxymethyldihydropteridine diphosphokinase [Dehalococcoidales bacterium]